MPLHERQDAERRHIRWIATPPLTLSEVLTQFDAKLADGLWQKSLVIDLRAAILPLAESRTLLARIKELAGLHGPHGPIALITKRLKDVAETQSYSMRSADVGLRVEVFWDIEEANEWIDSQR